MSGATECPTKPKGRPRKNSYYPNTHGITSNSMHVTVTEPIVPAVARRQQLSDDDDSMDQDSDHWDNSSTTAHDNMIEPEDAASCYNSQPDSPQISVTD